MLKSALIVGIGSFAGGMLRFIISYLMKNACSSAFPWGTFIVNLLGCLLQNTVLARIPFAYYLQQGFAVVLPHFLLSQTKA